MIEHKIGLLWHRVKFLALIAVFLSPYVGGWMALYVFEVRPESMNYGNLIQPPLKVDWPILNSLSSEQYSDGFGKIWTFILITRETCAEQCRSNLYRVRPGRIPIALIMPRLFGGHPQNHG